MVRERVEMTDDTLNQLKRLVTQCVSWQALLDQFWSHIRDLRELEAGRREPLKGEVKYIEGEAKRVCDQMQAFDHKAYL